MMPKKWKLINNSNSFFNTRPENANILKANINDYLKYNSADLILSPWVERYSEGATIIIQNWLLDRPLMQNVEKAMDLGFALGAGFGSVNFTHGLTLNYFSDQNNKTEYNEKLSDKERYVQNINNTLLKLNILNQRVQD